MAKSPKFEDGEFNFVIGAVGYPKMGKSKKLMEVLEMARKKWGCYILIHEPTGNLKPKFYPNLIRHADASSLQNAMLSNPQGWHVSPYVDAEETLEAGWEIARIALEKGAPPVIVYVDEMAMVQEAQHGGFQSGETVKLLFTQRRHRNMGILWGSQSPAMIHYNIFHMSTAVYIFKLTSDQEMSWLRKSGVTEEYLDRIRALKQFEFVLWRPGEGEIKEPQIFEIE